MRLIVISATKRSGPKGHPRPSTAEKLNMNHRLPIPALLITLVLSLTALCCGNDADDLGVGAECSSVDECGEGQSCLTEFKGGYCGLRDCQHDVDCPDGSACITHTDSVNYCFLICGTKDQCNEHRDADNEANCSSSVDFIDGANDRKACIPPSSGT